MGFAIVNIGNQTTCFPTFLVNSLFAICDAHGVTVKKGNYGSIRVGATRINIRGVRELNPICGPIEF